MNQEDPPKFEGAMFPSVRRYIRKVEDYEKRQRVAQGFGIIITDAAGGGKKISADLQKLAQAGIAEPYGLEVYHSEFTGEGDPPGDQARRVKARWGWFNNDPADNWNSEFVANDNATTHVYYTCTTDAGIDGDILSTTLHIGSSVPADPTGTEDHAPATTSRGLATITCVDGEIVSILNDWRGSRTILPIVTAVDCGHFTLRYLHTPQTAPDASSAALQDVLDRLAALEAP